MSMSSVTTLPSKKLEKSLYCLTYPWSFQYDQDLDDNDLCVNNLVISPIWIPTKWIQKKH